MACGLRTRSVAGSDLLSISATSVSDLRAPESGVEIISGIAPSLLLDVRVEGVEAFEAIDSQVVGHVDQDFLGAVA